MRSYYGVIKLPTNVYKPWLTSTKLTQIPLNKRLINYLVDCGHPNARVLRALYASLLDKNPSDL